MIRSDHAAVTGRVDVPGTLDPAAPQAADGLPLPDADADEGDAHRRWDSAGVRHRSTATAGTRTAA